MCSRINGMNIDLAFFEKIYYKYNVRDYTTTFIWVESCLINT